MNTLKACSTSLAFYDTERGSSRVTPGMSMQRSAVTVHINSISSETGRVRVSGFKSLTRLSARVAPRHD